MSAVNYKNGLITITLTLSLWLLVLSILFLLFFIGGPSYYSSHVYKELWNIGHIIFFTLSTYQLIIFFKKKSLLIITFIGAGYCLLLGSAIELLQSKIGRSMDLHDLYRDALGTFLALVVFYYQYLQHKDKNTNKKHQQTLSKFLLILCITLIAIDQKRLVQAIQVNLQAQNNFPILANFDNSDELTQWQGKNLSLSTKHVLSGLFSMKAELSAKTKYSGFTLKHMPSNWEGYSYLLINIYNPNKSTIKICTKISDFKHDLNNQSYNNRFNKCFTLSGNQWSNIEIALKDIENSPKGRKLDLSDMSQLGLFTSGLKNDKAIYLDSITLL